MFPRPGNNGRETRVCDSVWPPVCLTRGIKRWKDTKWMLCFWSIIPSHTPGPSPSLPYTCLFIFSFFPSPTIPRVCCGPERCGWSSANLERSSAFLEIWEQRRHKIGRQANYYIHKSSVRTSNTLGWSWIARPATGNVCSTSDCHWWKMYEWVN